MTIRLICILFSIIAVIRANSYSDKSLSGYSNSKILELKKSPDFTITGNGSDKNWTKTEWLDIPLRTLPGKSLTTKLKALYSQTGIYFLFNCQDKKLTATMNADFMDLWKEDAVEVFLWTDQDSPVYFEYEISPLNHELPILISNNKGDLVRWQPFHYDADRKTRHATAVQGGEMKSNANVAVWTAEFFIPYKLLRPLNNIQPQSGTRWRANFYRVDYDNGEANWSWQLTAKRFHEYETFGTLVVD